MHFTLSSLLFTTVAVAVASPAPEPRVLHAVVRRQVGPASLKPSSSISLSYASRPSKSLPIKVGDDEKGIAADDDAAAVVDGTTRLPSIVLEGIPSIGDLACSKAGDSITIPFGDATEFANAQKEWPQDGIVFITSSAGDCAPEGERGWYVVKGIAFDEDKKVATATTERSTLQDQMDDVNVDWSSNEPAKQKPSLNIPLDFSLPGKELVNVGPLSVKADVAKYTGNIRISGSLKYNFLKFKLSKMSVDVGYDHTLSLNMTTELKESLDYKNQFDFAPFDQTVSAFSIPGVLDLGPMLSLTLGVEVGAQGVVTVETGLITEFKGSKVHIDFLDMKSSTAEGWKPTATLENKFTADVSLQVNPYASLMVGMGVKAFGKLVDLTASIEAKPRVVTSFNAKAEFTSAFSSETGISFKAPANVDSCPNGAWFASTLKFDVIAKAGSLEKELLSTELPIYASQCYNFAKLGRRAETPAAAVGRRSFQARRVAAY